MLGVAAMLLTSSACVSATVRSADRSPWHAHAPHPNATAGGCRSTLVAAGDIVDDVSTANRTGRVAAKQHPDAVLVLGDNQYESGALTEYKTKYDTTSWGQLKPITNPIPGNHEYLTRGAAGYFTYFGNPSPYYAYDAGCGWRAYALNSEVDLAPEVAWMKGDLAAHPGQAVLAYWHRPRWSSGTEHGSDPAVQPLWDALSGRTGIVLNGHEHSYERLAPIDGFREFVVGTGGSSTYPMGTPVAGSVRRITHTPGVLRLRLRRHASYDWMFLDTTGTPRDKGST